MTAATPPGTTTTLPPASALLPVGPKRAAKASQAAADDAAAEIRRIDTRLGELDTEADTLLMERLRCQRIMRAAGVDYRQGRQTLAPAVAAGEGEED